MGLVNCPSFIKAQAACVGNLSIRDQPLCSVRERRTMARVRQDAGQQRPRSHEILGTRCRLATDHPTSAFCHGTPWFIVMRLWPPASLSLRFTIQTKVPAKFSYRVQPVLDIKRVVYLSVSIPSAHRNHSTSLILGFVQTRSPLITWTSDVSPRKN